MGGLGCDGTGKIGKGGMKWDGMACDKIDWNGIGRGGIRWVWERCLFTVSSSSYFKKEIMFRFQIAEGYKNDKELPDFPFTCPFLPANTIHAKASRLCLRLQALSLVGISSFTEYSLRAGSPLGHTREGRSQLPARRLLLLLLTIIFPIFAEHVFTRLLAFSTTC